MTATAINEDKYARLVARSRPAVIKTDAEYERIGDEIWRLAVKGEDSLTPEEAALLELLSALTDAYDAKHFEPPQMSPDIAIRHLMEEHGMTQRDLEPIFGSRGVAWEVINGKRQPSKVHVVALAKLFNAPAEMFLPKSAIEITSDQTDSTRRQDLPRAAKSRPLTGASKVRFSTKKKSTGAESTKSKRSGK